MLVIGQGHGVANGPADLMERGGAVSGHIGHIGSMACECAPQASELCSVDGVGGALACGVYGSELGRSLGQEDCSPGELGGVAGLDAAAIGVGYILPVMFKWAEI